MPWLFTERCPHVLQYLELPVKAWLLAAHCIDRHCSTSTAYADTATLCNSSACSARVSYQDWARFVLRVLLLLRWLPPSVLLATFSHWHLERLRPAAEPGVG
jgi:hypothetical protein